MIYAVELAPKALSALFALPRREAEYVSFDLFKLAESPRELSIDSAFRPGLDYIFRLAGAAEADAIWFTVNWQYKREEIVYIAKVERSTAPPA